ncbi:unnamed protein product [Notodromas monacha]|uniref:Cytokine-like nuclear factor N-PAC n=1 Tax=Notodromas monacha TaxID=399045 RepID=A0A7R9BF54_9CRUS|nr:unnamed protein product [Notodromas monacha]CAG0913523.1 unnamed protein product [Notodromas monacha]
MTSSYTPGDLVLAKMKGFSPWPGRIAHPEEEMGPVTKKKPKKTSQWVYFFGTGDYAWIEMESIKPYYDHREKFAKTCKTGGLKRALEAIEDYIEQHPDALKPIKVKNEISEDGAGSSTSTPTQPRKSESSATKRKSTNEVASGSGSKKPRIPKTPSARSGDGAGPSFDRNDRPTTVVHSTIYVNHVDSPRIRGVGDSLLHRPTPLARNTPSPVDVGTISESLRNKHIRASDLKFGFIGIGMMGSGILKNLLNSGHNVTIWSRRDDATKPFLEAGAHPAMTPSDVVAAADITFACITDPSAVRQIVFGNCGVLQEMKSSKAYVEMSTIDPKTSIDISEAVTMRGGRYLEAQMAGSRQQARDGNLVIISAGDRTLFEDCTTCFSAIGHKSFHIGNCFFFLMNGTIFGCRLKRKDGVGNACKINLFIQALMGVQTAALAEIMTMVEQTGLMQTDFLEILSSTDVPSKVMLQKASDVSRFVAIIGGQIPNPSHSTANMKKVLKLVLDVAEDVDQTLPVTATAHELFKYTMRQGYGHQDDSAVYNRINFVTSCVPCEIGKLLNAGSWLGGYLYEEHVYEIIFPTSLNMVYIIFGQLSGSRDYRDLHRHPRLRMPPAAEDDFEPPSPAPGGHSLFAAPVKADVEDELTRRIIDSLGDFRVVEPQVTNSASAAILFGVDQMPPTPCPREPIHEPDDVVSSSFDPVPEPVEQRRHYDSHHFAFPHRPKPPMAPPPPPSLSSSFSSNSRQHASSRFPPSKTTQPRVNGFVQPEPRSIVDVRRNDPGLSHQSNKRGMSPPKMKLGTFLYQDVVSPYELSVLSPQPRCETIDESAVNNMLHEMKELPSTPLTGIAQTPMRSPPHPLPAFAFLGPPVTPSCMMTPMHNPIDTREDEIHVASPPRQMAPPRQPSPFKRNNLPLPQKPLREKPASVCLSEESEDDAEAKVISKPESRPEVLARSTERLPPKEAGKIEIPAERQTDRIPQPATAHGKGVSPNDGDMKQNHSWSLRAFLDPDDGKNRAAAKSPPAAPSASSTNVGSILPMLSPIHSPMPVSKIRSASEDKRTPTRRSRRTSARRSAEVESVPVPAPTPVAITKPSPRASSKLSTDSPFSSPAAHRRRKQRKKRGALNRATNRVFAEDSSEDEGNDAAGSNNEGSVSQRRRRVPSASVTPVVSVNRRPQTGSDDDDEEIQRNLVDRAEAPPFLPQKRCGREIAPRAGRMSSPWQQTYPRHQFSPSTQSEKVSSKKNDDDEDLMGTSTQSPHSARNRFKIGAKGTKKKPFSSSSSAESSDESPKNIDNAKMHIIARLFQRKTERADGRGTSEEAKEEVEDKRMSSRASSSRSPSKTIDKGRKRNSESMRKALDSDSDLDRVDAPPAMKKLSLPSPLSPLSPPSSSDSGSSSSSPTRISRKTKQQDEKPLQRPPKQQKVQQPQQSRAQVEQSKTLTKKISDRNCDEPGRAKTRRKMTLASMARRESDTSDEDELEDGEVSPSSPDEEDDVEEVKAPGSILRGSEESSDEKSKPRRTPTLSVEAKRKCEENNEEESGADRVKEASASPDPRKRRSTGVSSAPAPTNPGIPNGVVPDLRVSIPLSLLRSIPKPSPSLGVPLDLVQRLWISFDRRCVKLKADRVEPVMAPADSATDPDKLPPQAAVEADCCPRFRHHRHNHHHHRDRDRHHRRRRHKRRSSVSSSTSSDSTCKRHLKRKKHKRKRRHKRLKSADKFGSSDSDRNCSSNPDPKDGTIGGSGVDGGKKSGGAVSAHSTPRRDVEADSSTANVLLVNGVEGIMDADARTRYGSDMKDQVYFEQARMDVDSFHQSKPDSLQPQPNLTGYKVSARRDGLLGSVMDDDDPNGVRRLGPIPQQQQQQPQLPPYDSLHRAAAYGYLTPTQGSVGYHPMNLHLHGYVDGRYDLIKPEPGVASFSGGPHPGFFEMRRRQATRLSSMPDSELGGSFLEDAKRLKNKADGETDKNRQVMIYMEAVLKHMLAALSMEKNQTAERSSVRMYQDTLSLIESRPICRHLRSKLMHEGATGPSSVDAKLYILCLRSRSLLNLKLFKLFKVEARDSQPLADDHFNKSVKPESLASLSGASGGSPVSPSPSPASSVGSQSSGYASNGGGGGGMGTGASGALTPDRDSASAALLHPHHQQHHHLGPGQTRPAPVAMHLSVSVPLYVHVALSQLNTLHKYLTAAFALWDESDDLIEKTGSFGFFVELERKAGPLSLHSSMLELVSYVTNGLELANDLLHQQEEDLLRQPANFRG